MTRAEQRAEILRLLAEELPDGTRLTDVLNVEERDDGEPVPTLIVSGKTASGSIFLTGAAEEQYRRVMEIAIQRASDATHWNAHADWNDPKFTTSHMTKKQMTISIIIGEGDDVTYATFTCRADGVNVGHVHAGTGAAQVVLLGAENFQQVDTRCNAAGPKESCCVREPGHDGDHVGYRPGRPFPLTWEQP